MWKFCGERWKITFWLIKSFINKRLDYFLFDYGRDREGCARLARLKDTCGGPIQSGEHFQNNFQLAKDHAELIVFEGVFDPA